MKEYIMVGREEVVSLLEERGDFGEAHKVKQDGSPFWEVIDVRCRVCGYNLIKVVPARKLKDADITFCRNCSSHTMENVDGQ